MLFSELLKFSKMKFFKQQKFEKENIESFRNILFVEMKISKLKNYLKATC
jgi:hypothetical protein